MSPNPTPPSSPTKVDLARLESQVAGALRTRDHSALPIMGFGEISVALGWPTPEPTHVCKRMPPATAADHAAYKTQVEEYIDDLTKSGLTVVPTSVMAVERGQDRVVYLVQPLLSKTTLGDQVLAQSEPDDEHPFLEAVGQAITIASDRLSVDGQVTNWSWDGAALTLIDVGTPFVWDEDGAATLIMDPFLKMLPAPTRAVVRRDMKSMLNRWQTPRGVAVDLLGNLLRIDEERWMDPAIQAMNRIVDPAEPIRRSEAEALIAEDLKTWPRLKKLQRTQRAWQTTVRRRPYDFFIQNSYDGTTD